ncbi:hypothetical protein Pcinc_003600 [Petrolisthes cinctipes]|uniref:Major facilitator superfamily (MFS) profile domain-containing protein n=1 Tax=Petrolisthes cinctipes TaxID=88211 RepID=A0AAE1L108_PETCI|nr:hypothetical protein Pcinc_003600 [Petrolisthes cinctipes]
MVMLRSGIQTKDGEGAKTAAASESSNGSVKDIGSSRRVEEISDSSKVNKMRSRTQRVVFLSLILDLLGFTVILPLFPALLNHYSQHDSSGLYPTLLSWVSAFQLSLGIPARFHSVLFGGLLGSMFSLLQFLSSPLTGALSDVYGRKPILILTLVGVACSYGLWAAASNFAIFVLARVVGGATKGNVSLAYSIMTDVSDNTTRAKGMAMIGVAFSVGFTIGPAIGAAFSRWGSHGWFPASAIYALILALANILYFSVFFTESLPKTMRRESVGSRLSEAWDLINPRSLFSFTSIKGLSKEERGRLMKLGRVYFLFLFLYSGLEFTLTFVTHHKHNYDSMDQARMFTFLGLVMAGTQGGYVRRIQQGSEILKATANRGLLLMIPSFILVGVSESSLGLYTGLTLYAIGSSLMVPCLTALASCHGAASHKGTLLGIWRSLGALARAIGPIVTSVGFWSLGAEWCYVLGGISMIIPWFMLQSY